MNDSAPNGGTENASLMSLFPPPTDIKKTSSCAVVAYAPPLQIPIKLMSLVRRLKDSYDGCLDNTDSWRGDGGVYYAFQRQEEDERAY